MQAGRAGWGNGRALKCRKLQDFLIATLSGHGDEATRQQRIQTGYLRKRNARRNYPKLGVLIQ